MKITNSIKKLYRLKKAERVLKEAKLMDKSLQTKLDKEAAKYGLDQDQR